MRCIYWQRLWSVVLVSILLGACAQPDAAPGDIYADARDIRAVQAGVSGSTDSGTGATGIYPDPGTSGTAGSSGSAAVPAIDKGVTSAPAPAPVLQPDIVYNATLAPQLVRAADAPAWPVLQVGVETVLSFGVGAQVDASVTPGMRVAAVIGATPADLPLTIILGCEFCPQHAPSRQQITYRPAQKSSDSVSFTFTPGARKDGKGYNDTLYLIVMNGTTGFAIDRVDIPVTVRANAAGASAAADSTQLTLAARPAPMPVLAPGKPDLIIYAEQGAKRTISLSIEPISEPMKTLLDPLVKTDGKLKSFTSGHWSADALNAVSAWSFESLRRLSLAEQDLALLRATGNDAIFSPQARETLRFDSDEMAGATRAIAATGQQLYAKLFFGGGDQSLAQIIDLIEIAGAKRLRPLRIQIVATGVDLSWQYLHPVGPVIDPRKFWGMRFSLNVISTGDGASGTRVATPRGSAPPTILFAHYGTSSDASVALAMGQIDRLKKALPDAVVTPVYAGADLLKLMDSQKEAITGFVTFLHASAGNAAAGQPAPHIEFGAADKVSSSDFAILKNRVPNTEQDLRYLARGPIALLNACETGPAFRLTHSKLSNELFGLGVRGAIVTEISVWQTLGDDMAARLFAHLATGATAADALSAARRELLAEKNNPLGLLYAYYGEPGATLTTPTGSQHGQ